MLLMDGGDNKQEIGDRSTQHNSERVRVAAFMTLMIVFLSSVAIVCHSTKAIMRRFLFHAQDRNMTNGDYAFLTFSSLYNAESTEKPWALYDMENDDDHERRLKAFYSLKQVPLHITLFQ